jgi:hypothetical protein
MNLGGLSTRTTVNFQTSLSSDTLIIHGHKTIGKGLERVSSILYLVSENNFQAGVENRERSRS